MSGDVRLRTMDVDDPARVSAAFTALGWHKPVEQYERYLQQQRAGERFCLVAEVGDGFAGYCTLVWRSSYPPFREAGTPEIKDLNVLPRFRRRGVGNALLQALEDVARRRGPVVGLGVGLNADYGAAQRIYVRRGYLPDGRGVVHDGEPVPPGELVRLDDDANLMLAKQLT